MASGDVKMAVLGNIHMYIRVIEVSDFKFDVKLLLLSSLTYIVARSSKGPLPSCYASAIAAVCTASTNEMMSYALPLSLPFILPIPLCGIGDYSVTQSCLLLRIILLTKVAQLNSAAGCAYFILMWQT